MDVTHFYFVSLDLYWLFMGFPWRFSAKLWSCNFNSQLANALIIEGDYHGSILALQQGLNCAMEMCYPELQVRLNCCEDFKALWLMKKRNHTEIISIKTYERRLLMLRMNYKWRSHQTACRPLPIKKITTTMNPESLPIIYR